MSGRGRVVPRGLLKLLFLLVLSCGCGYAEVWHGEPGVASYQTFVDRDPNKPLPGNVPSNGPANMFGPGNFVSPSAAEGAPSSTNDLWGVGVTFHGPVSVDRVRLLYSGNGVFRTRGVCVYVDTTALMVSINGQQQKCTPTATDWNVPAGLTLEWVAPVGDRKLQWGIGVTGTKVFIDYPRSNARVEIADLKIDYTNTGRECEFRNLILCKPTS